ARSKVAEVAATRNLDEPVLGDPVQLPQLLRRVLAENLDAAGAPQARTLEGPQCDAAQPPADAADVLMRHPFARAILERRGRQKRVQLRHAPRGGQPEHAIARERSEEHTSELQSRFDLVCRLLL